MAKFLFVILVIACILFGFDRIVYATELGDGSIVIEGQVIMEQMDQTMFQVSP